MVKKSDTPAPSAQPMPPRSRAGRWCGLARALRLSCRHKSRFLLSRRALHTVAKESMVKPTPPQPSTVQGCCKGRQQLY